MFALIKLDICNVNTYAASSGRSVFYLAIKQLVGQPCLVLLYQLMQQIGLNRNYGRFFFPI